MLPSVCPKCHAKFFRKGWGHYADEHYCYVCGEDLDKYTDTFVDERIALKCEQCKFDFLIAHDAWARRFCDDCTEQRTLASALRTTEKRVQKKRGG